MHCTGTHAAPTRPLTFAAAAAVLLFGLSAPRPAPAQSGGGNSSGQGAVPAGATADLKNREGQTIGRARLTDTPNGVLITVTLERAPAGEHAFHIHDTGRCDAPAFESAGGHFNPTQARHGFLDAKGPHRGDLPNIHVPSSGQLAFEYVADGVTLSAGTASLLDQDGSALVMHAKPDDYRTDPAGAAGDRVGCAVIQKH
jgi:superoxide dismutase, Cu-Zn family